LDPFSDFISLWGAGRLLWTGQNPYDRELMIALIAANVAGITTPVGGFHNPFWTLPLFLLVGVLPYPLACGVWSVMTIAVAIYCVRFFINERPGGEGDLQRVLRIIIAVLCFFPLLKHLFVGQTTIFALGGLILSLKFYRKEQWFRSGLALSATLLKPHLFVPLYVLCVIAGLRSRRLYLIGVVSGFIFALVVCSLVSLTFRPTLLAEFVASTSGLYAERLGVPQVTLGHAITILTGVSAAVPMFSGLGVLGAVGLGMAGSQMDFLDKAAHALFLGAICAPYGWSHDHVILLVPYLMCAENLLNRSFVVGVLLLTAQFLYSAWLFSTDAWNLEWGIILVPMIMWSLYFAISKRES
jgi:hypothetical protein